MNHLTDEELVERYYGADGEAAGAHLKECTNCAAALAALENELAAVRTASVPERDAHYPEQMWARVEAALPPREVKQAPRRRFGLARGQVRRLGFAAGYAVLALGAFYLGRMWEQRHTAQTAAHSVPASVPTPAPQPKVVVVVLGDHLDRSERLLVELKHANADSDTADLAPLPAEARSLLAANHVFRNDAQDEEDPALTEALDHLDRVLTEIASRPGGLDAVEAARIRDEMNAEGLLFEVRVLRSKNLHRTKAVRVIAKGGAA
jgi:hypothetical protein